MSADHVRNVGSRRQLFMDERFVESAKGVRFEMGVPVQYPEPVLTPDRPWEERGIGGYNTVLREPGGLFRAWYAAVMLTGLPQEGALRLAYAESEDGLHWRKPELGLVSFRGDARNNIVAPLHERQSQQGAAVLRDEHAPPEERYKLLTKFRASNAELAAGARNGLYAMHSPDGLRWRLYPDQPCSPVMCDTQNAFFYDDRLRQYVAYTRVARTQLLDEAAKTAGRTGYRTIGRMTSPDFRVWSDQEIVMEADAEDLTMSLPEGIHSARPLADFYTSCAMKYPWAEDAYLALPAIYHHWDDADFPATLDVQLLTSRDGIAWRRQGDRRPFLRKGADGGAAGGMIFANPWLIEMGDGTGTIRRRGSAGSSAPRSGATASWRWSPDAAEVPSSRPRCDSTGRLWTLTSTAAPGAGRRWRSWMRRGGSFRDMPLAIARRSWGTACGSA